MGTTASVQPIAVLVPKARGPYGRKTTFMAEEKLMLELWRTRLMLARLNIYCYLLIVEVRYRGWTR